MTEKSFTYIDNEENLANLVKSLEKADSVALDTEADSLHRYEAKVCLMQLTLGEESHYIVDPQALPKESFKQFFSVLKKKELIIHGADYDLRMLDLSFGFRVQSPVFDTMIASQLLGYFPCGLASLVQKFFDTSLCKKGQKSDWSRRPLTEEQLVYAVDDTRYLLDLKKILKDKLEEKKRVEWHVQSCQKVVEAAYKPSDKADRDAWRIKGAGKLESKELAYLKALWKWRDTEARRMDRPAYWVLRNEDLLETSRRAAIEIKERPSWKVLFPKGLPDRKKEALKGIILKVDKQPKKDWPEMPERKKVRAPGFDQKSFDMLREACKSVAENLSLEVSQIASVSTLKKIIGDKIVDAKKMVKDVGMNPWQADIVEPLVKEVWRAEEKAS